MKCAIITPVGPGHAGLYQDSCLPSIQAAEAYSKGPFQEIIPLMMDDTQALHGRSARRNDALQQALDQGVDWVFFLDADDLLSPMAFEAFGRVLAESPNLDGIWGLICEIDPQGEAHLRDTQAPEIDSYEELLGTRPVNALQIGAFVRAEVAARYGFDISMDAGEDYKFYYQIWKNHTCKKVPEIFFMNRRGQHSTGARSATGRDWVRVTDQLWCEHVREGAATARIFHDGKWARMRVTNPMDTVQAHHVDGRFFHAEALLKLQDLIKGTSAPRMAEIGAGIGNNVVFCAQHVDASKIFVIEPDIRAAQALRENVQINGFGDLVEELPDRALEGASLLDGQDIDLLRISLDGRELDVLQAAADVISRCRPLIWVEIPKTNAVSFMRNWLPSCGYQLVHTVHYEHTTDFFVAPKPSEKERT